MMHGIQLHDIHVAFKDILVMNTMNDHRCRVGDLDIKYMGYWVHLIQSRAQGSILLIN